MIWVAGRVVDDDALTVSIRDRTFEHGLGLFETLRTHGLRAPLLDRHLERLTSSARTLGLPLDPSALPDGDAVRSLLDADGVAHDVVLRITLTGGLSATGGSTLWMRTGPLPPPPRHRGAVVEVGAWTVLSGDPMAGHKALNYWSRRLAHEAAQRLGCDETLSTTPDGRAWEGSRTSLFAVVGDRLLTPTLRGPIVPGIMRKVVLELAAELVLNIDRVEGLTPSDFDAADEVFLTNSVRGVVPVASVADASNPTRSLHWSAPGPWTQRLALLVHDRLNPPRNST